MNIDWSKAPEDATHFSPAFGDYVDLWAKTDGSRWMYRRMSGGRWHYGPEPQPGENYVARPASWNGEGLPPVGLKVEALIGGNGDWCELTLKYRSTDFSVFERGDNGEEFPLWNPQYSSFRPIRTAEQIAAEKECAEIKEIAIATGLRAGAGQMEVARALYKAGYRKQVQP